MTIDQYVVTNYYKLCSKELGHTKFKSHMGTVFFYVSTPFLLVMAAAAAAVGGAKKLLQWGLKSGSK